MNAIISIFTVAGIICAVVGSAMVLTHAITERCKTVDCRSSQEKIEQAKSAEELKKICMEEYGTRSMNDVPVKCVETFKLK